ncbi:MAG: MarR family transcriptional regulator [Rhodothermales bacterium]
MSESKSLYCNCLYYSANAFARAMTRLAEDAFSAVGLAPSHALLLLAVNKEPGIQPGELARIMQLQPSTVTRLVEKLESKKLVERRSDGRASRVFPTEAALALDAPLREAWNALYVRYGDLLGQAPAAELAARLTEATARVEDAT